MDCPCFSVFCFSKDDSSWRTKIKEEKKGRRKDGKKILESGREWILPAQLGQLKTGEGGKGLFY